MDAAMSECFPVITVKRKSTEDPWITEKIRKKIRKRKAIFKSEGRSVRWKRIKKITAKMIKFKREQYMERHKLIITSPDLSAHFFKNVRAYNSVEKPVIWNVSSIRPNLTDAELAIQLSVYFNEISNEFSPLRNSQIPVTYDRPLPVLKPYQVAMRIKNIKKPKSKIKGDIFPCLLYTSPSPRD